MTETELDNISNDFIKYFENPYQADSQGVIQKKDKAPYVWATDRIHDFTIKSPEKLFPIILAILEKDPSNEVLEVLAAGPLEDYLATNNEEFIVNVENRAKEDPKFASLLGGVWQNGMTEETWARVQKVWDRSGWDGIPNE
jgi:hypothetical protein